MLASGAAARSHGPGGQEAGRMRHKYWMVAFLVGWMIAIAVAQYRWGA
ncbi:MAG: hypothetical protein HYV08_02910 [Deltaproteobacteria bacterium]|nr:hypothetical protein [Deltaproteobacteria bacterium]MBI3075482.1 hypothetical protein [Deltaproteobacteria bacterium]